MIMTWEHLVTRRIATQVIIAWNYGLGSLFQKDYGGSGISNTLVFYDGKKTEYFVDREQHVTFNQRLDKLLEDNEALHDLIPDAKRFIDEKYAEIREMISGAESRSNEEIAELFRRFSREHAYFYTRMWMVFRIGEAIANKLETLLRNLVGKNEAKELVRVFSSPLEPNEAVIEQNELRNIPSGREDLLKIHTEKYEHIPMYDFDHDPFTLEHFRKEWVELRGTELVDIYGSRKHAFEKALERISPDPKLKALIMMQKEAVFLRDYRDSIRQKLNLSIRNFYRELGVRIGLSVKEVALLTNDEIIEYTRSGMNFPKQIIKDRKKAFLVLQKGDTIQILDGESARAEADRQHLHQKYSEREVTGVTGSPGVVSGPARIVHTNLDLQSVQKGDVLIAHMTRQDFVSHMRKVVAIVTNEGGVASHAAIIARELKLPCIVGTGHATEVFFDGDLVEVDADKGTVKKL